MSANAALKGYRTQFLYSLYHILKQEENGLTYKPEGIEDLDVVDANNNIIQVVQVKNLANGVSLSDILTNERTSFLKRYITLKDQFPETEPILVSYSKINKELAESIANKNFTDKDKAIIKKYHLKESDWKIIKQKLLLIEVKEDSIYEETITLLKVKYPTIDPKVTIEILLHWLTFTAEKSLEVTVRKIHDKIEEIATYLTERIAIQHQLGIFIKPINDIRQILHDPFTLKNEFYAGVNARYEHILNDLDVIRENALEEVKISFSKSNVVIIHGASGQGKSTLVYRYAKNASPDTLTYEVSIQNDYIQTAQAIQSIISITKGLNAPVLFIINTIPNSVEWIKVVREFSSVSNIKFLISIREEDWIKAISAGVEFLHTDMELLFDKDEAKEIYKRLNEKITDYKHTDFEEAWIHFGEKGPLLEFVYTITQGNTLETRLKAQVNNLIKESLQYSENDIIELLRLVCLADNYDGRINILKLTMFREANHVIQRLQNEYLIKIDKTSQNLTGLHGVRSQILLKYLFDEHVNKQEIYFDRCIRTIDENYLHNFLLNVFYDKKLSPESLIENISQNDELTWGFYGALVKSLLWVGIRDYIDENRLLFDKAYDSFGDAWFVLLDFYHTESMNPTTYFTTNEFIPEEKRKIAIGFNSSLTPKKVVFKYLVTLTNKDCLPEITPNNKMELQALSEILFWMAHIRQGKELSFITEDFVKSVFENYNSETVASFILSCHNYSFDLYQLCLKNIDIYLKKLKIEFNVPILNITEGEIFAHYLEVGDNDKNSSVHKRSRKILETLRRAFPDKKKYNVQGHGHKLKSVAIPYDESYKAVSIENLPLEELVSINSIKRLLYEYDKRPNNWIEYNLFISNWKHKVHEKLIEFIKALTVFYNGNPNYQLLGNYISRFRDNQPSNSITTPKTIHDKFGIFNHVRDLYKLNQGDTDVYGKDIKEEKLYTKYEKFIGAFSEYRNAIDNFERKIIEALYNRLKCIVDPKHEINEEMERIAIVNCNNTLKSLPKFYELEKEIFEKYLTIENNTTVDQLYLAICGFKLFQNGKVSKINTLNYTHTKLDKIKNDLTLKFRNIHKKVAKNSVYKIKFQQDAQTRNLPVIFIDAQEPLMTLQGVNNAYNFIKEIVGCSEYTSLKQLILETNYEKFVIVPLIQGQTLNHKRFEFPLYLFRDKNYEDLELHNFIVMETDINIKEQFNISDWAESIHKVEVAQTSLANYCNMQILVEHMADLSFFQPNTLDETGEHLVSLHIQSIGNQITPLFQGILDWLNKVIEEFPLDYGNLNEMEQGYCNAIIGIKNNIFPFLKGDEVNYKVTLELSHFPDWAIKLHNCMDYFGILYYILCGKYIKDREKKN